MKALLWAVLLAAILAALIAALAGRHGDVPPETRAVVLRRGNGAEPESLDPHSARSEAALTILRDLYEGLTEIGPDGAPVLAAADRCAISSDGITYRFHLRAQAHWSNGEPVVAEDFAAAWRRLVDPHTGAQYAQLLGPVQGAEAITAGPMKGSEERNPRRRPASTSRLARTVRSLRVVKLPKPSAKCALPIKTRLQG